MQKRALRRLLTARFPSKSNWISHYEEVWISSSVVGSRIGFEVVVVVLLAASCCSSEVRLRMRAFVTLLLFSLSAFLIPYSITKLVIMTWLYSLTILITSAS